MACRTIKGFPGSARLREAVTQTRCADELIEVLDLFEREGNAVSRMAGAA